MMNHRERIQACIQGDLPDRTPVALWRHFPVDDQSPGALAVAHLTYQNTYDYDLVKVTPASSFCLKDWGVDDIWEGNPEGTRRYFKHVISKPADWEHLSVLDPRAGMLGGQLECLRAVRAGLGPDTPMLQTIFSPLAQARHLAPDDMLLVHLRSFPEAVMKGLEIIAESTRRFIQSASETGIDGIFYAVQHAQANVFSQTEFTQFARPLDLQVLEAAAGLWCNMLHIHGSNVYFDAVADYPVHILNWHDQETPPSLSEARDSTTFRKSLATVFCGGLGRDTLALKTPAQVRGEAENAIRQTSGKGLILSTGCVVPIVAPHGNLVAAREAALAGVV